MAASNNGSFIPLSIPVGPSGSTSAPTPPQPKPILGHVVQASAASVGSGGMESGHKDKYKWHTVVDGFSKFIIQGVC